MRITKSVLLTVVLLTSGLPGMSYACGGFFCQLAPINQAAEQIVFRQDGNQITAMVQIQFEGEAEDFSWVVPVPSSPELDVGSNRAFTDLDQQTRPVFNLQRNGSECARNESVASPVADSNAEGSGEDQSGGVNVESVQNVGGYVATVISGDNAEEVTQWLVDNNYDLTQRGRDLLAPYVEAGMKFVAVKLQQNRGTGSIQPLIMKYQSDKPVVPIRLTAVAALEDMGVLVWFVGDGRAVPENYLHVIPNYTRLDWFNGSFNAYGSYQSLITEAMNEAGGQGFATDYAGRFNNLLAGMTSVSDLEGELSRFDSSPDAEYLSVIQNAFFGDAIVAETIANALPLRDGQTTDLYFDQNFLVTNYTAAELSAARASVDQVIRDELIQPLQASLNVLGGNRYLTRLYTTLSADEMTLDPSFVFNSDMGDQPLEREATLDVSCIEDRNHWTLKLGAGTGRNGEVVIDTIGPLPFIPPTIDQEASFRLEETSDSGQPVVNIERTFQVASLGSPGTGGTGNGSTGGTGTGTDGTGGTGTDDNTASTSSSGGGGGMGATLLLLLLVSVARRR